MRNGDDEEGIQGPYGFVVIPLTRKALEVFDQAILDRRQGIRASRDPALSSTHSYTSQIRGIDKPENPALNVKNSRLPICFRSLEDAKQCIPVVA